MTTEARSILENIIEDFNPDKFLHFFRRKSKQFSPSKDDLRTYNDESFSNTLKVGEIKFADADRLIVCAFAAQKPLTERSGKKAQYEKAKKILKEQQIYSAGIFIFYDQGGNFRFSLIYPEYAGRKREWSNFRRFTYFVKKAEDVTNKTFLFRIGEGDFSSLEKIKDAFSVEKVTREFYEAIANWYFWAVEHSRFPQNAEAEENGRNISVIRLITRVIFIWFMRERGLVPKALFEEKKMPDILNDIKPEASTYYKAILQNLFFATLSTRREERQFRSEVRGHKGYNPDFGNQYVCRYHDLFKKPADIEEYFSSVPFLNGGLFECLDDKPNDIYIDGFTAVKKNQPEVPNFLFFGDEKSVDLNTVYGTKNKKYKIRGLLNILSSFNFTIDENSLDDQDVALDPELLGRVFENLLASFNPETATTARKATGSYYTPRGIVDYMVSKSLKAYFKTHLADIENVDKKIDELFSATDEQNPFNKQESAEVVGLIESVKIVDPAVGSGAFPMGALHKMVSILNKVDPGNVLWKQAQIKAAGGITDPAIRRDTIKRIEDFFQGKNADYGRKLYLIQRCIYGVDIQQIAVEIAKLRFFIALLVDEKIEPQKENWGIEPLPNLDFKIMQGNSLISNFMGVDFDDDTVKAKKQVQIGLDFAGADDSLIKDFEQTKIDFQNEPDAAKKARLKKEIENLLIRIFEAKIKTQKADYFKALEDIERRNAVMPNAEKRAEIIAQEKQKLSKRTGFDLENIEKQLREFTSKKKIKPFFPWRLYFAEVFEQGGFDIVIGNPPYGILNKKQNKNESIIVSASELEFYKSSPYYEPATGGMVNIFRLFILRSIHLLSGSGILSEIFPLAFVGDLSISKLRKYIIENNQILSIEAFPERDNQNKRVFEAAKMSVCILNLKKEKSDNPFFIRINKDRFIDNDAEKNFLTKEIINIIDPHYYTFPLTSSNETNLLTKIFSKSIRFNEIGMCNVGEVDMTFCKKSFTSNSKNPTLLKGAIIDRYQLRTKMSQGEIVFIDEKVLFSLKKNLPKDFKTRERIVSQGITGVNESSRLKMMIVKDAYCANSLNYLTLKRDVNLKYLLGVFNSKLLNFIFSKFSTNSNVNGYEVDNLPIIINDSFVNPIATTVEKILSITKDEDYIQNKAKQVKVREYEAEIDKIIYNLYGLTDAEKSIVEGR